MHVEGLGGGTEGRIGDFIRVVGYCQAAETGLEGFFGDGVGDLEGGVEVWGLEEVVVGFVDCVEEVEEDY